jgi:hypothetical protein
LFIPMGGAYEFRPPEAANVSVADVAAPRSRAGSRTS